MLKFLSIIVNFSDDARYFPARDGGYFVTAKDGSLLHVDQLGQQTIFICSHATRMSRFFRR